MPFELIYHNSPVSPEERSKVVFHRHAEVIVPKQLDLEALRFIACRSQAEYETLLHLLPRNTRSRWEQQIGLHTQMHLYFKKWTYLQTVDLDSDGIAFHFKRFSLTPGPFLIDVSITETVSNRRFVWKRDSYNTTEPLKLSLGELGSASDYTVNLLFDKQLAYAGRYQQKDLLPW